MTKIVKLTESDLQKLVQKIIKEDDNRRVGYGNEEIRNLQKGLAPDEDVRLTDYSDELRGEVVKKKDYVISWLRDIIQDEDWNKLGDVILYIKHRM